MLDDLLGRTTLKERIEELEEENRHLERELEAEEKRRADAVTDKQEAQRQVNRLEDRIEQLEDRIERLQTEESPVAFRTEKTARGGHLDRILDRLASIEAGPEGLLTAYVPDGHDVPDAVRAGFGKHSPLVSRAAPCLAVTDDEGLLGACLSTPVSPEPFAEWDERADIDRSWFQPQGEFTFALIRSDIFAMGTYEGNERTAFHGFEDDLKSQHSKGGFSQSRFERLRDEQIDDHLDRCRIAIEERTADPLYVVGERSLIHEFAGVAAQMQAVDATGDPEPALDDAFAEFWTVHVQTL